MKATKPWVLLLGKIVKIQGIFQNRNFGDENEPVESFRLCEKFRKAQYFIPTDLYKPRVKLWAE